MNALAAGTPTIAFREREWGLRDGENSLILSLDRAVAGLAAGILKLAGDDDEVARLRFGAPRIIPRTASAGGGGRAHVGADRSGPRGADPSGDSKLGAASLDSCMPGPHEEGRGLSVFRCKPASGQLQGVVHRWALPIRKPNRPNRSAGERRGAVIPLSIASSARPSIPATCAASRLAGRRESRRASHLIRAHGNHPVLYVTPHSRASDASALRPARFVRRS